MTTSYVINEIQKVENVEVKYLLETYIKNNDTFIQGKF